MAEDANAALLETLQRLLEIPAADLRAALSEACDAVAAAVHADKVDAFLYDATRDSLVALGTSAQPLSAKQHRHGLDVLQIANGGRTVHVYETGETFVTGHLEDDEQEVRGIRETLAVRSQIGVPLQVAGKRRGVLMIASLQPDAFSRQDVGFAQAVTRWIGSVAHRAELVEEIERNAVEQGRRVVADELITMLAHDLRNFISPMDFRLRAIRRRAELEGRAAEVGDADAALKSVARLGGLIADILDAARIDQGVLEVETRPIALDQLVDEVINALATAEHPIVCKSAEQLTVDGDPRRIRQCLENVLANAVRHSPSEAPVTIATRRSSQGNGPIARIEIIDEGPGIAPELLPHVFERFVTGKGRKDGLGLGLYLAKRIATLHNGDLCVESKPGKGARFTLTLPCYIES
ncbi:MAG TPA: GAF domain-containing sensor histidine kinase [Gammaproteobacteria bacterium]|nr:GAF domain-containing sensor histidine kinase [Gammaproteobacteria bacterium]